MHANRWRLGRGVVTHVMYSRCEIAPSGDLPVTYVTRVERLRLIRSHRFYTMSNKQRTFTIDSINPQVLDVKYAVRGEIADMAAQLEEQLQQGEKSLPFDSIVWTNIGNPQLQPNLGQAPLTYWRQIAALTEYPALLDMPAETRDAMFPKDVQGRARELLHSFGSVGAYTASKGSAYVRKHIAEFLEERDGHAQAVDHIYLTNGASGGVSLLFQVLFNPKHDGVLIPIPQYPLYSATLSLLGVTPLPYALMDSQRWDPSDDDVERQVQSARERGVRAALIVVINPGNPTGSCMSYEQIYAVLKTAYENNFAVLADEVYQANVYQNERPFVSFRKVLLDLEKSDDPKERDMAKTVELISLHSISKGMSGECGRRGGFFVLNNIDEKVEAQLSKMASVSLCPPVQGQIGVDLLVRPPREGEASYETYQREFKAIYDKLNERSHLISDKLSQLEGVKADAAMGALYMFPRIHLPKEMSELAKKQGKKVDELYCTELLKETGICVVPGSGFGFMPIENDDGSTYSYFRTTILAKETDTMVERYSRFHQKFMSQFS